MKAMILAAGLGERMRPLSQRLAKPVMPVLGRPLVQHTLERLAAAGVRDVVVNLHHLPDTVRAGLRGARALGLRLRYSNEPILLGTGGGPRRARRLLGDEPVLIVNGDVLFDFDLRRLLARHHAAGALATLALRANPDPRRYGPIVTDGRGRILAIKGRPQPARGALSLFTGVQVVSPKLFERLPPGRSDSVDDLYIPLLGEGAVLQGVRLPGAWYDLGRPALYLEAQLRLLRRDGPAGRALVDPRARVHPRARVASSVIGPGCQVAEGAEVRGSVLWPGARVSAGARVARAVLADGVVVPCGERWERCVAVPDGDGAQRTRLEES